MNKSSPSVTFLRESNQARCNLIIAMQNHGIGAKKWPIVNLYAPFLRRIIFQSGKVHIFEKVIKHFKWFLCLNSSDDVIDVDEFVPPVKTLPFLNKEITHQNFVESEQKLSLLSTEENNADWEETVKRDGWTPLQHRIFNKVCHTFWFQFLFMLTLDCANRL